MKVIKPNLYCSVMAPISSSSHSYKLTSQSWGIHFASIFFEIFYYSNLGAKLEYNDFTINDFLHLNII